MSADKSISQLCTAGGVKVTTQAAVDRKTVALTPEVNLQVSKSKKDTTESRTEEKVATISRQEVQSGTIDWVW
jgi:hypothetical protein